MLYLHYYLGVPDDGVCVESQSGVEPQIELLLSATFSLREDVCVQNVGLSGDVPQELEVYLIMSGS